MVSTAEKYAFEIEIYVLNRGFRAQISRSGAQKRRFQRSPCGQSGRTDFFNRIDPKQPIGVTFPVHVSLAEEVLAVECRLASAPADALEQGVDRLEISQQLVRLRNSTLLTGRM